MASALVTFPDFMAVTGPAFLTSAEEVVNEAALQNYGLRRFIRGKDPSEMIQGGSSIRDTILFDEDSTFQFYHPDQTFTWEDPAVLTNWEIFFRFAVDHMRWTDHEIELNIGGGLSRSARHHQYKRLKRVKEQRLWTSMLNGMENQLFAIPETGAMETNTGLQPYSIPAFINQGTNGLFYADATPAGKTAWTTVQGINPATQGDGKWAPAQLTYSSSAVNNADNIISNFDEMWKEVRYVPPPSHQEYFDDPKLNAQFIATSKRGHSVYQQLLRESQDTFVTPSRQDPSYMMPKYAGIDIEYIPNLDDFNLYWDGNSGTVTYDDEIPATAGSTSDVDSGPRFYWINAWYLKPVFHTTRYMVKLPVRTHPNQPMVSIMPVDCWYNFVCRSRRKQGILYPSGTVYS